MDKIKSSPVAASIPSSNSTSGLSGTTVQTQLDELATRSAGSADFNKILTKDQTFSTLVDDIGNVLWKD